MALSPTAPAPATPALMPSPSLLANFRQDLARYPPFAQMDAAGIDFFLTHCEQRYYGPGEVLVQPADGVVREIFFIRQGAVSGVRGLADLSGGAFQYEAGDLFPLSAAVAQRAATATYSAAADTFVLVLPCAAMRDLAKLSPTFADFLNRRIAKFLELSRRALQVAYSSQALAEQSLETPLSNIVSRAPVSCGPDTPLREALETMHRKRVGSMLVVDAPGRPIGILTRYDVLGRVALGEVPLSTPIGQVMVKPVHSLSDVETAQEAALLMSRHGIRHVPVTRGGVAIGLVSERDLFAMQRLSLKQVSTSIRSAPDVDTLKMVALDIRRFARSLLSQGVQARQLTALISHLNDVLTQHLLELKAAEHGVDLGRHCWLALGSEGRSEQTVATDQDNALILANGTSAAERDRLLAFAHAVNLALDACGYPLCRGGVMAGEPGCCLTLWNWSERFSHWIGHGAPRDLLNASIYFDLRPLAGDQQLALQLQGEVLESARRTPRFLRQMALNALSHGAPLNWLGGIDVDERGTIDLKLQGTAIFVDAARLYSLAHGSPLTSTRQRLEGAGTRMGLAASEYQAWAGGFEFLQMLRLRVQLETSPAPDQANRLVVAELNDIDRRILKESLRVGRSLQQRLHLDYER
jgi:CBS domain-containing protein